MPSIGELINQQFELRTRKSHLAKQVKDIEHEMLDVETQILEQFEALGTDTARTSLATATKTTRSRWNIGDYALLTQWILESPSDRIYLFERRLGQAAVKELLELGTDSIPGTELFEKQVVSLRTR